MSTPATDGVSFCDRTDEPLCFEGVDGLASKYRSGVLSPVDLAQVVLARIDRLNPQLCAYYELARDSALASARESEARHRAGRPLGALDGVPVSIKDTSTWPA